MCGICGILDRSGDPDQRRRRVGAMARALRHRGPDEEGFFGDAEVDLGFQRLAVIDLETGNQPIRLADDLAVIVLNGEIYNFRELRRDEFDDTGFSTRGDVEVVLRLYLKEGLPCIHRLNGMFALAIWDARSRTLHLARDRFGIKPLYYCIDGDVLGFASEASALDAAGLPRHRRLDVLQLHQYLRQGYLLPSGGIWQGVSAVPPATVLSFSAAGLQRWTYWEPPCETDTRGLSRAEAGTEVGRLLQQAVTRQLVADVPVGVFLSGGLDSTSVATLAGRWRDAPLETFSVGFDGPGAVNELPFARRAAAELGCVHHEFVMTAEEAVFDLDQVMAALDGPLADPTVIPTWYLSRLARGRVTVALAGEGADEVFGGYARQRLDVLLDRVPSWVPSWASGLGRFGLSDRLGSRLALPAGLHRQLDWSLVFGTAEIDGLLAEPRSGEQEFLSALAGTEADWLLRAAVDPVNARLFGDLTFFLAGDLLPKVDRMSMAHSLEVRVPFLDHELTDFVLALPGKWKVGVRRGKRLLRAAVRDLLPAEILDRPKQGFDVPMAAWLRGPLRSLVEDCLLDRAVKQRGLLRPEPVGELLRQHTSGRVDHSRKLWALLALELWLRHSETKVRENWA